MEKFSKIKYQEILMKKISDFETSFLIAPLERGFGNTIGNSLRRVLLSSVSGIALFGIKIKNVKHEFEILPNVRDDVVQLILNLKNVQIKYNPEIILDDDKLTVSLRPKKGEVRAEHMVLPPGLEIINPSEHITYLEKDYALDMELFIKPGRGFVPFSQNKENIKAWQQSLNSKLKSGQIIAVDSDFSPIQLVGYEIKSRTTKAVDIEEELRINITTNGSISAKEALSQAAYILAGHLMVIGNIENLEDDLFIEKAEPDESMKAISLSISSLDLSVRSYNSLKRAGIEKISDLIKMSREEIAVIKNLGKKSLEEILEKLSELGIKQTGGDGE